MGSDARHTAQPRPASPSQGNTSTPAGPGGCHATSQPASPSESRGRRHLPHRGNVGSKSPAWLQAHRERFPNQCPPLHPAFLPKSLFGYLGLERSQVLSSTTALLPRSADARCTLGTLLTACIPGTAMPASAVPSGRLAQPWPCCLARPGLTRAGRGAASPTNYCVLPAWGWRCTTRSWMPHLAQVLWEPLLEGPSRITAQSLQEGLGPNEPHPDSRAF